jgi:hypothetical protein
VTVDHDDGIDSFAVYCPDTDRCYWASVEEAGKKSTSLRLVDAGIDHPAVRHAAEYRFAYNLSERGRARSYGTLSR